MSDPPSRRWPLSRGQTALIVMLLLAFGLLFGYLQWDAWAQRLIQAQIDAAHARGEFILLDEFPRAAPIPDEQNAAIFWARAAASAELTKEQEPRESDHRWLGQFPPTPEELAFLREILNDREVVWRDVARTRDLRAVDWQVDPTAFARQQHVPELNDVRQLANMLSYHALVSHVDGNDAAVIADVRDILRESRDVGSIAPSLITHLVSIGISALGAHTVERVAPDLAIASNAPARGEASSDDVRSLIHELLDESSLISGFHVAMQAERATTLHLGQLVTGKPVFGTTQKVGLARTLKWQLLVDDAVRFASYPEARKYFDANPPPPQNVYQYIPALASILHPSLPRAVEVNFRIRVDRRLAALALAIRWYQCDHNGKLPDQLAQLVPKYLPAVPLDPLAPDGRAIEYHPGAARPIIYSIGIDGIDDGGSVEYAGRPPSEIGDQASDRWLQKDAVMYLIRILREGPATQPSDE